MSRRPMRSLPIPINSARRSSMPSLPCSRRFRAGRSHHYWTKDLALSPDGRFLYASVGSNSNAGERGLEAEKGRAAIWQVDRATGASRVFASGLRNPNGLNFHPETGNCGRSSTSGTNSGPISCPRLRLVREGGFYGWPWSYYGQHVDERVRPPRPDLVQKAISPDYALSSHVAALGLAFTNDSAMPEAYRNGEFLVGNRGSWNRNAFNGYKVIYIPFANGRPSGMPQDVVTGFLDGDQTRQARRSRYRRNRRASHRRRCGEHNLARSGRGWLRDE